MTRINENWEIAIANSALSTEIHNKLQVSHRQAKGLVSFGCVKVNDNSVHNCGFRLSIGDKLTVSFDPNITYPTLPNNNNLLKIPFDILWEDKHLVFVNKQAGLLTVPTEKTSDSCLAEVITNYYRRRGFKRFHLFIAHRLDRYTSGVLVFAKTPEALHGLKDIFAEHRIRRIYIAVLVGELPDNMGTLSDKLIERKSLKIAVLSKKNTSKDEYKNAHSAITHYRVLERLPGHTIVEVTLETGRRNQIRVQFADRGFPILGDQIYGQPSALINRQALHAELLGLKHPVTKENINVTAPIPKDMQNALKQLRNMQRVLRAESGITGQVGIYQPKSTKSKQLGVNKHNRKFVIKKV